MNEAKKVKTSNLRIEKNVISLNNMLLQISNISQVSIEPIPKKKIGANVAILFVLGILGIMQRNEYINLLGSVLIIFFLVYIVLIWKANSETGQYLHIYMNSENHYFIYCASEPFLKKVMEVIEFCINNHCVNKINIDLNECRLYNSPIIVGSGNEVS